MYSSVRLIYELEEVLYFYYEKLKFLNVITCDYKVEALDDFEFLFIPVPYKRRSKATLKT